MSVAGLRDACALGTAANATPVLLCFRRAGLYEVPGPAKVAAAAGSVKRPRRDIKAELVMTDDVASRRRRAVFRASHRGTKEMDWLIGRFAESRVAGMPPPRSRGIRAAAANARPRAARYDPLSRDRTRRRLRGAHRRSSAAFTDWNDGRAATAARRTRTSKSVPGASEVLSGVPDGLVPLLLGNLIQQAAAAGSAAPLFLHIARDDRRLEAIAEGLAFFAPKVRVIPFPAWDTVPYDRIGPNSEIVATAHCGPGASGGHQPQRPHRRPHHRQRHPAAHAAARVHPPFAEDHRAGPAARHGRADPASQSGGLHAQRHGHGARRIRGARRHPRPLPARPRGAGAPRFLRRHAGADEGLRSRRPSAPASSCSASP